jgi:hypothetical protein
LADAIPNKLQNAICMSRSQGLQPAISGQETLAPIDENRQFKDNSYIVFLNNELRLLPDRLKKIKLKILYYGNIFTLSIYD